MGFVLQRLRLPSVAAYIVVGVLCGPAGLSLVSDSVLLTRFGGFGVVLLLFRSLHADGTEGLSTALGAFLAGIFVSAASETHWFHEGLGALRVLLVAVFFVSIRMLLDLSFLREQWQAVLLLVLAAFYTNTFLNALMMKAFGRSWQRSFYASAFLAQIGECSFVLAAVGYDSLIINEAGYRTRSLPSPSS